MTRIVEYIGKEGVISSDLNNNRYITPHFGDPVIWEKDSSYPFNKNTYGRVDSLDAWGEKGKISVICEPGSVFLDKSNGNISGGPFYALKNDDKLEATYTVKLVKFWNFGDNFPGAGKGCFYYIERPVFKIVFGKTEECKRVLQLMDENFKYKEALNKVANSMTHDELLKLEKELKRYLY